MDTKLQQRVITWLKTILKVEEVYINSIDLNSSEGFIAEIIFVNITLQKNNATEYLDLVVKKGIDDHHTHISFPQSYVNEINVYSNFIPLLREFERQKETTPFEHIPFCYGTILEDDQKVIIMENLRVKGFRIHDSKKPIDINHMNLVLEAYAKFHALSLALRDQESKKMDEFKNNCREYFDIKLFDCLFSVYRKELRFILHLYEQKNDYVGNKRHVIEKLKILEDQIENMSIDSFDSDGVNFWVLCHADNWNNNYLFNYDHETKKPNKVFLIDWQFAVFASPLLDVTAVLFYCSSKKELEHVDDFLKFYYNTLSTKLKELGSDPEKCFPWEICLKSFKKYVPLALAAVPASVKMRCEIKDLTENAGTANDDVYLNGLCEGEVKEPEKFFDKVDEIFEFCIEKGFL